MMQQPREFAGISGAVVHPARKEQSTMKTATFESASRDLAASSAARAATRPSHQAYQILHLGFTVAPILAGLDKFFNLMVDWTQYLPSFVNNMVGGHGHALMMAVGVIEIAAGIGVALKPRIFSYVVAA